MKLRNYMLILAMVAIGNCNDKINVEELLTNGNNQFTANLFSEAAKNNVGKSFVLSPFSVLTPLAQLSLASEGESHDELLRAIGSPSDESTKSIYTYMNTFFKSIKGIDLKMASKIYVAKGYTLNENYAAVSREIFQSEFASIDFTESKKASEEINAWVEDQTNHRIKDLVNPSTLSADTTAVLVNAIYFKGMWKEPFDKDLTRDREFHLSNEKSVKVPMMFKEGNFFYGESAELNAKVLGIPFKGDESAFYILLPNDIGGLTELENKLKDPSTLDMALKSTIDVEVQAFIPKFRIETTTNLKKYYQKVKYIKYIYQFFKIGVDKIFVPAEANLNKLLKNTTSLYVSDATQKAFIEINEEGGEAAAANEFAIMFTSAALNVRRFVADHPFVFMLKTGQDILFQGVFAS